MKPFQVKIPHRCSSTSHLNLYHWSVGKMFPEKILSAEFSTDYCTATVEAFGVFAVLNGQPSTPDVLYAKLDVGDLYRDNIGKLVTKVHFGKTFSGRVLLVPRGSACSTAVPCMSFLPRFLVRNGSTVDKIELEPLKKLKGYTLNSWSNRQAYIGRMFIINFSFIVQAVAGIHAPTRLPMVDCKVILFSSRGQELLTFENGNEIRIQVTTTDLKIYVSFEERLAPMSYTCTLQGRESLRDIRVWVAKCIGGNEIEPLALSRFSNLRFVSADRSDYLSLSDECFEHASAHLPEVRLQALTKLDVRYGSEGDVVDMLQDVFMRTRQAPLPKEISQRSLPSLKSKSGLSQQLTLGRKMPLLGCPTSDDWTQPSVDSLARYKELSKELDRHGGAHLDKRARNLEGTVANESKWLRSGFLTSREESSRRTRLPRLPLDQVHSLRNRSRLDGFFTSR
ncbi:hypothetical protein GUITHDRAFT_153455 [Guillardia theta CCMP2712]|uniref:Uncharacterized protein n=2 Tax=Guillardia theta TaxID=55529 RepID=L1J3H9_GUITC|nr:hypothetical protein GUITHDRAFT_153455 [Guillardia theta CCMP2712]EKX42852.1 hypothetical protein GUITHDRAFT_153455 [Guillardia theta CCMP2712]|eukprot:XP_005829832.1 hypothetical protein GUITHDRAFT_153455 [Guillardia theta CCMP2712]